MSGQETGKRKKEPNVEKRGNRVSSDVRPNMFGNQPRKLLKKKKCEEKKKGIGNPPV